LKILIIFSSIDPFDSYSNYFLKLIPKLFKGWVLNFIYFAGRTNLNHFNLQASFLWKKNILNYIQNEIIFIHYYLLHTNLYKYYGRVAFDAFPIPEKILN
jgi:hypothetical protein